MDTLLRQALFSEVVGPVEHQPHSYEPYRAHRRSRGASRQDRRGAVRDIGTGDELNHDRRTVVGRATFAMRVTASQREDALMTPNFRAACDQEALISFESGLPLANSVTLRKVVSLIVVIASRVKNA